MKKLVITLVVVLALLVGADFGARAIAESRAGEALAREAGTTTAPDVDITGFPFLTQAIGGEYDHITVSLVGAELANLPLSGVVDLYQVHFPLSDAMSGDTSNATADRATMIARTPVSGFAAAVGRPELELSAIGYVLPRFDPSYCSANASTRMSIEMERKSRRFFGPAANKTFVPKTARATPIPHRLPPKLSSP